MINDKVISTLYVIVVFAIVWGVIYSLKYFKLLDNTQHKEPVIKLEPINRFEVINYTGRIMVMNGTMHYDIQDNRNTLKVFLGDKKLTLVEDEQNV